MLALAEQQLNINSKEHRDRLEKTLESLAKRGHRRLVIILDNLSSLLNGIDENDNSALDDFLQWLLRLRHSAYTVVLVHHAGKSGQQRGASRREDILDTSIKLEAPKDDELIDKSAGATFYTTFTKTRGRAPVPNKLLVTLREGPEGLLEFQYEKSFAVPSYLKTLRAMAEGVQVQSRGPSPYQTQKQLVEKLRLSKGAVSKHLDTLRADDLYSHEPQGFLITALGVERLREVFGVTVHADLCVKEDAQTKIPI